MIRAAILTLVLLLTASGCAFLEVRGRDLADCVKASVALGVGVEAHVQVGPAGVGLGLWVGVCRGVERKQVGTEWAEWDVGMPVMQLMGILGALASGRGPKALAWGLSTGCEEVHHHERGSSCIFYQTHNFALFPRVGVCTHHDEVAAAYRTARWADFFWIAVSAKFFVGGKIGFNIAEFADFLLGWFGLDLCGDDDRTPIPLVFDREEGSEEGNAKPDGAGSAGRG